MVVEADRPFFSGFFLVGGCLFFLSARGGVPPDNPVKRLPGDDLWLLSRVRALQPTIASQRDPFS